MTTQQSQLTHKRLKELLHYNAATGVFFWRENRGGNAKAGSPAGHLNNFGRWVICIDGIIHKASRLVWIYMTGEHPLAGMEIDHIDQDRGNDSWPNLRLVTRSENLKNKGRQKNNRSGFTGVYWHKSSGKYRAHIYIDGKEKHLGLFETAEEASEVYEKTKLEFGFDPNHGKKENVYAR